MNKKVEQVYVDILEGFCMPTISRLIYVPDVVLYKETSFCMIKAIYYVCKQQKMNLINIDKDTRTILPLDTWKKYANLFLDTSKSIHIIFEEQYINYYLGVYNFFDIMSSKSSVSSCYEDETFTITKPRKFASLKIPYFTITHKVGSKIMDKVKLHINYLS
jgi:hypothetical protein|nr:MAG TPA: hypothetical protein [Caudoviricetes sp.]